MRLARRAALLRPSMIREQTAAAGRRPLLSLGGGLPPPEAFPVQDLAEVTARLLASGDPGVLQYGASEGDPALLELLGADLVTTGSQQALDLVGKVLLDPGDAVVVECPTYVGALRALAPYEPTFVSIPVDADGLDTAALEERLAGGLRPKACYVVANFSNPSGATLSLGRRRHLAELADRYDFLVIEDDVYRPLRFHGDDLPTIEGPVLRLGSVSKIIAPAFRVGWATVPEPLLAPMVMAKQATDLNTTSFGQRVVHALLSTDGWLDAHLVRLRALYRARAEALVAALDERYVLTPPDGGLFLWARTPVDALAFTKACMARDVAIVPGSEFALVPGYERDIRLSYSMLGPDEVVEAVRRMGEALDELTA
jgi:2-aminoadipate transaminase